MDDVLNQALVVPAAWTPVPARSSMFGGVWWGLDGLRRLYHQIVLTPLARIYLHGPALLGFWNGLEPAVICAQKTHLDSAFWQLHTQECLYVIGKHFYSGVILLETLVYFALLWVLLRSTCHSVLRVGSWCLKSRPSPQSHVVVAPERTQATAEASTGPRNKTG